MNTSEQNLASVDGSGRDVVKAVDFHQRPASINWEAFSLSGTPNAGNIIWVWFKPHGVQNQLSVTIPAETFQENSATDNFSLLRLLHVISLDVSQIASLSLYGIPVEINCQDHPIFHQQLLPPKVGSDPHIHFIVAGESEAIEKNDSASAGTNFDERELNLRRAIDLDWNAVRGIETQLKILRKQLVALSGRLNSLNRDLNAEEMLHADSLDLRAWQDARRWLRDMTSRLTRYIKEYDIGMTSSAGSRQRLNQIHQQFILTALPLEGIEQIQREFETYRKMTHNLMQGMSSAHASAKTEGEQRAQQVLRKIAAKTRAARTRRK